MPDKALTVCEAFAGSDFILANILGMIAAPHLNHRNDFAKLAIDGYLRQPVVLGDRFRSCVGTEVVHVMCASPHGSQVCTDIVVMGGSPMSPIKAHARSD